MKWRALHTGALVHEDFNFPEPFKGKAQVRKLFEVVPGRYRPPRIDPRHALFF